MLPICGDITKIVLKNDWRLLFKILWLWKIITFGKWKGAGFYWIEFWDSFQTALHKPRLQFIIIIIISLTIVLVGLDSHTKYTRLGSFNRRCLFSLRKEARSPWSRGQQGWLLEALLCDLQTAVFSLCSHVAFPLCTHARASSAVPSCSSKDTLSITLGPYCYDLNSTRYSSPHCSRFPSLGTRVNKHFGWLQPVSNCKLMTDAELEVLSWAKQMPDPLKSPTIIKWMLLL